MCYSAMVRADYQNFVREYGAKMSIKDFYEIFWRRLEDRKLDVVRSAEMAFATPLWRFQILETLPK